MGAVIFDLASAPVRESQQIMRAAAEAEPLAVELLADPEPARLALARARVLAARSGLNLMVLGGEGHGKSTLINSITGLVVVPTSQNEPGTVAPIVLEWGPSPTPVYHVVFAGRRPEAQSVNGAAGPGQVACASADEFGTYLLQRHNRHNEKRVRCGVIRLDHRLLRYGLKLIDIPGVAGVSRRVAEETAAFIRGEACTAIAVIRNREYSPLLRLMESLPPDSVRLEAVVCNRDGDFWDEFESEEALSLRMAEQRDIIGAALGADGVVVEPQSIYVLHLPSMKDLAAVVKRGPTGSSHEQEVDRFSGWLRHYLRETRIQTRESAAALVRQVLFQLISTNDEQGRLYAGVRARSEPAISVTHSRYTDAASLIRARWVGAKAAPEIERFKQACWTELGPKFEEARKKISGTISSVLSRVRAKSANSWLDEVMQPEAAAACHEVRDAWLAARQDLSQRHEELVKEYIVKLDTALSVILTEGRRIFPLMRDGIGWEKVEYPALMQPQVPDSNPQGPGEWLCCTRIVCRVFDNYQAQLARVDTTSNGPQAKAFRSGFEVVEQRFDSELDKWLAKHRNRVFRLRPSGEPSAGATWLSKFRDGVLMPDLDGDLAAIEAGCRERGARLLRLLSQLGTGTESACSMPFAASPQASG